MMTNNSASSTHSRVSTTHSQSTSGSAGGSPELLASVMPQPQSSRQPRVSICTMDDVEMTDPPVSSNIDLSGIDAGSQGNPNKRAHDQINTDGSARRRLAIHSGYLPINDDHVQGQRTMSASVAPPAKRRGGIHPSLPTNDDHLQGKKPTEELADQLNDLCNLTRP